MSQTLRLNIPETVILEKGKPKKMYFLDGDGQLNVTRMKTSAELLRVLRNFIKLCVRREARRERESAGTPSESAQSGKRRSVNPSVVPRTQPTIVAPNLNAAFIAENKLAVASEPDRLKSGAAPLEVAVLHYNDGAVRAMTDLEAQQQIHGKSKLPKAFWGDIAMLQSTIQSHKKGVNTKYITYNFDLRSGEHKAALEDWSNRNVAKQQQKDGNNTAAVEEVPNIINDYLRKKVNLELISGQLEFMLDEADNTLWLVNASRLICAKTIAKVRDASNEPVQMEIKYFCEEEFSQTMAKHEQLCTELQDEFDKEQTRVEMIRAAKAPAVPEGSRPGPTPARAELLMRTVSSLEEQLPELHPTLQTLNEMSERMNKHYKEKVKYETGMKLSSEKDNLRTGTHNIPLLFETSLGDLKRTFSGSALEARRSSSEAASRVTSAGQRSDSMPLGGLRICRVPEKSGEKAPPPKLSRPQSASSQTQSQSDTALFGGENASGLSSLQGSRPGSRPPSRQTSRPPSRQMSTRPGRSVSEAFPAAPRSGSLV